MRKYAWRENEDIKALLVERNFFGVFIELREATGRSIKFIWTIPFSRVINSIARFLFAHLMTQNCTEGAILHLYCLSLLDLGFPLLRKVQWNVRRRENFTHEEGLDWKSSKANRLRWRGICERYCSEGEDKSKAIPKASLNIGRPNQTDKKCFTARERRSKFVLISREKGINEEEWNENSNLSSESLKSFFIFTSRDSISRFVQSRRFVK